MLASRNQANERGFVLATSLVMLSLMTLLAIAMYFNSKAGIKISGSAQHSTEGHFYAETGANYMIWATNNDAEFDNYDPSVPTIANTADVGDWAEWFGNIKDPGPTIISNSGAGLTGQVRYFDNTPMTGRALCVEYVVRGTDPKNPDPNVTDPFTNCINLWESPAIRYTPTLYHISSSLPRYIVLEMSSSGVITPSIPALPHPATPVVGTDVPNNGAIVWLTTGNSLMDFEVDPLLGCTGGAGGAPADVMGCDKNPPAANPTGWLRSAAPFLTNQEDQHGVIVYSIGYVNGRPNSIVRAQIR